MMPPKTRFRRVVLVDISVDLKSISKTESHLILSNRFRKFLLCKSDCPPPPIISSVLTTKH